MPSVRSAKCAFRGKKRAYVESSDSDDQNVPTTSAVGAGTVEKVKKSKRAVTKKCPVCDEEIPVRLLERHADLEAERLDEIIAAIGSVEVLEMAEPDDGYTARTRKSAVRARKNMQPHSRFSSLQADAATLELLDKSLRLIKRHRKQRHAKLREMSREDEDGGGLSGFQCGRGRWAGTGEGTLCPVCLKVVPGDPDVVEAHVDACLAYESRKQEEREREESERQREESPWEEIDVDGDVRIRVTDGANLRGMGFLVRDRMEQDIDDEVDIDGEDETKYGAQQFSEGDIVNPLFTAPAREDEEVDIEENLTQSPGASSSGGGRSKEPKTLDMLPLKTGANSSSPLGKMKQTVDDVVWAGELEGLNRVVQHASEAGNTHALVEALRNKVKMLESRVSSASSLLCRICLDPYTEPTVSTGCWHTCCKECWLRCLGSTKLCPICKRITAAADLRRIYL